MKNTNEKGSSLIEVLGVLAIIGVMSAGVFTGIAAVQSKIRIARAFSEAKNSIKTIRQTFSSFRPENISASILSTLGILPDLDAEGYGVNVLGQKMTIQFSGTGSGQYSSDFSTSEQTFRLIYKDVDIKTCIGLLSADWGSDPSSGLAQIIVGDEDGDGIFRWAGENYSLPPAMEDVMAECTQANTVDIYWEYYF